MTEILQFDEYWQKNYPDGYTIYMKVYQQRIVSLYLWYCKHIRRYGKTKLFLIGKDGHLLDTVYFELVDPKRKEGPTIVNGLEFPTIHEAWRYYQDLVFKHIVEG